MVRRVCTSPMWSDYFGPIMSSFILFLVYDNYVFMADTIRKLDVELEVFVVRVGCGWRDQLVAALQGTCSVGPFEGAQEPCY